MLLDRRKNEYIINWEYEKIDAFWEWLNVANEVFVGRAGEKAMEI